MHCEQEGWCRKNNHRYKPIGIFSDRLAQNPPNRLRSPRQCNEWSRHTGYGIALDPIPIASGGVLSPRSNKKNNSVQPRAYPIESRPYRGRSGTVAKRVPRIHTPRDYRPLGRSIQIYNPGLPTVTRFVNGQLFSGRD